MLKKRIFSVLLIACLLLCASTALAEEVRVFDYADLLDDSEAQELQTEIDRLRDTYQTDFVVLTTEDTEGKEPKLYCADFFEAQGCGLGAAGDGILFCIDMEHRQMLLVCHGGMQQVIDDSREEALYDVMYDDVAAGDYYTAFRDALSDAEQCIQSGPQHGQFTYDQETGAISGYYYAEDDSYLQAGLASGEIYYDESTGAYYYNQNYTPSFGERMKRAFTGGGVAFGGITGLLGGLGTILGINGSYKKKFKPVAYDFQSRSNVVPVATRDTVLSKNVTTRIIPRNEDRGGGGGSGGSSAGFGSGTFSSSSGGSFSGGGGRSF